VKRRGQSLVETTLVLVAFMGLLVGVIDVGQTLVIRETLADRVQAAVRWGVIHAYDPGAIRNLVLFGTAAPGAGDAPIFGLKAADIVVRNLECPGPDCRVSVAVASHGVEISAPQELAN